MFEEKKRQFKELWTKLADKHVYGTISSKVDIKIKIAQSLGICPLYHVRNSENACPACIVAKTFELDRKLNCCFCPIESWRRKYHKLLDNDAPKIKLSQSPCEALGALYHKWRYAKTPEKAACYALQISKMKWSLSKEMILIVNKQK